MKKPIADGNPMPAGRPNRAASGETILLVEDEKVMRRFLIEILSDQGYRVLAATNGEDALSVSQGFPGTIHLLITDVMMPVMNGKELADRLCSLRPEIKVLFISGYSRADVWPDDACEDHTDWLPKPFTELRFRNKVREILDSVPKE